MELVIRQMLQKYETASKYNKENAIKEIMQEIVLCGLSRAGFFKETAFYGGTALRIFYGLDRFSEDLDFSLLSPNPEFDLRPYCNILESEVRSFGLNVQISVKEKTKDSMIKSAFVKGSTIEHMLMFYGAESFFGIPESKQIKIKLEVDIDPPGCASFEHKYRLLPSPYEVNLYDAPSLFAGKIHAVICRAWKNRVKGRDLYDYVFYLARKTPVNLEHLWERLRQSEYVSEGQACSLQEVKRLLLIRFEEIDYKQAKEDVQPFIKTSAGLDVWGIDFFRQITEDLQAI